MRKIISLSMGVALAVTVFAAVPAAAESAVVSRGGPCLVPSVDANGDYTSPVDEDGDLVVGTVKKSVINDNHSILNCRVTGIVNGFGRTKTVSGWPCGVPVPNEETDDRTDVIYVAATESRATVTKDGKATSMCKIALDDLVPDEVNEEE